MPPFLLIQGKSDRTVPIAQTLAFEAKLKAAGVPCDFIAIEGAPHALLAYEKFDPTYKEKMIAWLDKTLGAPSKP